VLLVVCVFISSCLALQFRPWKNIAISDSMWHLWVFFWDDWLIKLVEGILHTSDNFRESIYSVEYLPLAGAVETQTSKHARNNRSTSVIARCWATSNKPSYFYCFVRVSRFLRFNSSRMAQIRHTALSLRLFVQNSITYRHYFFLPRAALATSLSCGSVPVTFTVITLELLHKKNRYDKLKLRLENVGN
jgi:hypothetical protein